MLDLFSGIGGFHKGFEKAGYTFDWVGFCEIDKYANAVYRHRFPKAEELGDVKLIQPKRDLPGNIDIICGGFPCQAFSVAGHRRGFDDSRGTLFFEIARILKYYRESGKPIPYLVLENVKGLLSHDGRRTFSIMYKILTDLGYTIEYEVLNTRDYGIPQNRERVFIVGYLGNRGGPKVFPIGEECATVNQEQEKRDAVSCIDASYYKGADGKRTMINQIGKVANGDAGRVFDSEGLACTLKALGGGWGAKTGLYKVGNIYKSNGENGNVYNANGISPSLKSGTTNNPKHGGIGSSNAPKIINQTSIRRLTPVECMRLQGFEDDWNEVGDFDGVITSMSDTQRYKQAGNAVTVDVVTAVAKKIRSLELEDEKG
jgi:DNA (cytosine-5)-methyltransferase 1